MSERSSFSLPSFSRPINRSNRFVKTQVKHPFKIPPPFHPLAIKKKKRKKGKEFPRTFDSNLSAVLASHENFPSRRRSSLFETEKEKRRVPSFPFPEEIRVVNFFKIPRFESRISNLESGAMKRGAEKRKWEGGTKRKTPRSITFLIETEISKTRETIPVNIKESKGIGRIEDESVKIIPLCVYVYVGVRV